MAVAPPVNTLPDTIVITPAPAAAPVIESVSQPVTDAPSVVAPPALPVEIPPTAPELPAIVIELPASSAAGFLDNGTLTEGGVTSLKSNPVSPAVPLLSGFAPSSSSIGGESPAGPVALAVALLTLVLLTRRARDELVLLILSYRYESMPVPPG